MYRFRTLQHFCNGVNITSLQQRYVSSNVSQTQINKILIANRGEIACRILKTAKKLGVRTVAVYSDADRGARHVTLADEAYYIGPAASSQSYLRQDKIISVAKKAKCQAIHPGYGFLSENAEFAEFCQKENIIFIGPPAKAIRDMGIKNTSKNIMAQSGVPVIQGYHGDDQSNQVLQAEADKIGFPIMIKAVRGGGGKGMRVAWKSEEFLEALESAREESEKSFGDSAVLLEKFISEPRHVEVQVFADKHGNAVHLFERDCSVQRRHQKIIEEAPAPGISDKLRAELGAAAVRAAQAVGYVGAGTVEFILDKTDHSFHFMEMNTRLQVEHPVTEFVTNTDLVEWQLMVAAGEKLPLTQDQIQLKGHAFEARIYAENPRGNFLPGAGPLLHLTAPKEEANVRVETGVRQGDEVSIHYDPMIAKLVVWGNNRTEALQILHNKLAEYNIAGVETNIDFIRTLCQNTNFQDGKVHTGFIEENHDALFPTIQIPDRVLAQAALGLVLHDELETLKRAVNDKSLDSFAAETGFRVNHTLTRRIELCVKDEQFVVDVEFVEPEVYLVRVNEIGPWYKVSGVLKKDGNDLQLTVEFDNVTNKVNVVKICNEFYVFDKNRKWQFEIPQPKYISSQSMQDESFGAAVSPMPGVVNKVLVQAGDVVRAGDSLLVIVAMKMEHIIRASADGVVKKVLCQAGEAVGKNKLLIDITSESVRD